MSIKELSFKVTIQYETDDDNTTFCPTLLKEKLEEAIEHERQEGCLTPFTTSANWVMIEHL